MAVLDEKLKKLAAVKGIDTSYQSGFGYSVEAEPAALISILNALGGPSLKRNLSNFDTVIKTHEAEVAAQLTEPVWVLWEGRPLKFILRLGEFVKATQVAKIEVRLESGETRVFAVRMSEGKSEKDSSSKAFSLKEKLPFGYHEATVRVGALEQNILIISSPWTAYQPQKQKRALGVFAPLYAIHSKSSWGIGDFSDLEKLVAWAYAQGCDFVGTLPMLSIFNGKPLLEPSPYSPLSRLHWNEMYVDPRRAPGWATCAKAQKIVTSESFKKQVRKLQAAKHVDYRAVAALKRKIIQALADQFFTEGGEETESFQDFVRQSPTVVDYAEFRAVCESRGEGWRKWPSRLRDGTIRKGDYKEADKRFHLYAQYLAHLQLSELAVSSKANGFGVYIDFPLSVHSDGYDVWRERGSFALGATAGAPPDPVFVHGQDWSILPLNPRGLRETGYRYVRRSLESHMRYAGLLRLDHVMGFYRLFWVPPGLGAKKGVYVRYNWEEFFALLVLESHRNRCVLIGEDLGTVPPEIRKAMEEHDILRMAIQQFSINPGSDDIFSSVPERSIVSLNTHDIPPFAAFWKGLDLIDQMKLKYFPKSELPKKKKVREEAKRSLVQLLRRLKALPASGSVQLKDVLRAILLKTAAEPVAVVQINLEDLWLETLPQNTPGTWKERPNWIRKSRVGLEALVRNKPVANLVREVAKKRLGGK